MNEILTLQEFAKLRHKIWLRKTYGYKLPVNESAILDQHHYTNLWRELDRNSIYLFNNIQSKSLENFEQTVADTIRFRLFNKIETSEAIIEEFGSLQHGFSNGLALYSFLSNRTANFTGAYVRCPDLTQLCHANANAILEPIAAEVATAIKLGESSNKAWKLLRSVFSIGDFLADQLLMDLTWVGGPVDMGVMDVTNYFTPKPGPGAKAGLQYCKETGQGDWDQLLETIQESLSTLPMPTVNGRKLQFDGRTLEHLSCEFQKHVKFQTRGDKTVKMRNYKPVINRLAVDPLPWSWKA